MKTAISIPTPIFEAAEEYAQRTQKSRSQLFVEAMVEYLERHRPDEITRMINETIDAIDDTDNAFVYQASYNMLKQSEW